MNIDRKTTLSNTKGFFNEFGRVRLRASLNYYTPKEAIVDWEIHDSDIKHSVYECERTRVGMDELIEVVETINGLERVNRLILIRLYILDIEEPLKEKQAQMHYGRTTLSKMLTNALIAFAEEYGAPLLVLKNN